VLAIEADGASAAPQLRSSRFALPHRTKSMPRADPTPHHARVKHQPTARTPFAERRNSADVGDGAERLSREGRRRGRRLEDRRSAGDVVPAGRRRDDQECGVASDASDNDGLRETHSITHSTGRNKEKALQPKSLQSLIFTQSGRRDLNSTAPMRGGCFIGTYMREVTALVGIGSHGPANITANTFSDYGDSRLAVQRSGLFLNRLVRRLAQCLRGSFCFVIPNDMVTGIDYRS
jgi:hypothetical protein